MRCGGMGCGAAVGTAMATGRRRTGVGAGGAATGTRRGGADLAPSVPARPAPLPPRPLLAAPPPLLRLAVPPRPAELRTPRLHLGHGPQRPPLGAQRRVQPAVQLPQRRRARLRGPAPPLPRFSPRGRRPPRGSAPPRLPQLPQPLPQPLPLLPQPRQFGQQRRVAPRSPRFVPRPLRRSPRRRPAAPPALPPARPRTTSFGPALLSPAPRAPARLPAVTRRPRAPPDRGRCGALGARRAVALPDGRGRPFLLLLFSTASSAAALQGERRTACGAVGRGALCAEPRRPARSPAPRSPLCPPAPQTPQPPQAPKPPGPTRSPSTPKPPVPTGPTNSPPPAPHLHSVPLSSVHGAARPQGSSGPTALRRGGSEGGGGRGGRQRDTVMSDTGTRGHR